MQELFLDTSDMSVSEMEQWGKDLTLWQRQINWYIGDLARAARARLGEESYSQAFPPETSPGLIQRCEAVANAYPAQENRNPLATWSQHMQVANKPDRLERIEAMVTKGQTTDESRKTTTSNGSRWLLAIDVTYFLHRFWFSGAGVEAAVGVATWIQRTVERLKEKGLTDVACCFDSHRNHRKELTSDWEDKYKDRPPKDPELGQQLNLVYDLLKQQGLACVRIDGMEADDCLASFAKQFEGRVTLLTQDKDVRQCLSEKVNILLDVEWQQDETSGDMLPDYKWLSSRQHTEATGISPSQWVEFQALMGDPTDGIKGAVGIGEKGAADLIKDFGSASAAIQAAKTEDKRIKPKKREALREFEAKLESTLQLVTLVDSLPIPQTTRI